MTLAEKIADAIGIIPANNPSYISAREETLRDVLSPAMINKIAQVAAYWAEIEPLTDNQSR